MRWLGIDHGAKVLGVALSDRLGMLARPLCIIRRRAKVQDFARIADLLNQHQAEAIVVGLPIHPFEGETKHSQSVRRWAGRLAQAVPVPVWLWDESYSSIDAEHLLAERRSPDQRIDDAAAAVILQAFLDARRDDPQAGESVADGDEGA